MTDEFNPEPMSYNRIQHSFAANGDHVVIRGDTGEEVAAAFKSYAENAEAILYGANAAKQAMVASGVFTGDSLAKAKAERKADSPPPSSSSGEPAPTCKHGPMDDLRGRGYKSDFYCTLKTENWKDKCKPVKV